MEAKQLAASLGLEIADYMDLQLEHVHSDGTWSKNIFEDYGCLVGWFFSYLNVAAEASFCCGNKILGDLNETNFKDLWQSPDYALFRNKARAFDWDDNLKARNETMLLDEFCHNCDNHNFNMEMVDILKKLQLLPFVQKKRKKHLPKSALKNHIKKENTKASKGWYFNVSLTDSCQFRCQFCDTWKNPLNIKTELTAAQWIKVFENTKSLFEGTRINFSGGEPLLKKNFHHLLRWLSLSGQKTSVSTNAGAFTRQKAYEIATSGLGILGISLDGLETTHDTLRGTPGAYTKVRQTIEWIREWNSEMEINILTIILKENLEDIKKLVQWVETDPMVTHIHFQALSVLGKSESKWWDSHPLWPDNKEVEELLDFLISHRKKEEAENIFPKTISNIIPQLESMKKYFENPQTKSETPCGIHESGITLSPQGELLFCPFMKSTGSAFLNKAETLITSSEAEALKQRIINCPEHHCHLRVNCCFESD
jgi:MoaA/NifB/PqqE/SkfB family radical SAM enzyme